MIERLRLWKYQRAANKVLKQLSGIPRIHASDHPTSILALPYYPSQLPGSLERIALWKELFEQDGFRFDVGWASSGEDIAHDALSKDSPVRYSAYHAVLESRATQLLEIPNYDIIWIQRAAIPFFPFNDAIFEKELSRIHPRIVYDYYDADYLSNESLTFQTVKNAAKVSVASEFLKDKFASVNSNTEIVRFAISDIKSEPMNSSSEDQIKIGWMGSPTNFDHVRRISGALKAIEERYAKVTFSFRCRTQLDLPLNRAELSDDFSEPAYKSWIKSLDIGIVPGDLTSERSRAKTAMKSLEFMRAGKPMVATPVGLSDKLVDGQSFLAASDVYDWEGKLSSLIESKVLRREIGESAQIIFNDHHTYSAVYPKLKQVLTKWNDQ